MQDGTAELQNTLCPIEDDEVPAGNTLAGGIAREGRKWSYNTGKHSKRVAMYYRSQSVSPRQSMRSRPRRQWQSLPAMDRPNLFSGD
jgi:hypothetical protein